MVVQPPSPTGGRRVRVDDTILGLAFGIADVWEFLRRAGMDADDLDLEDSDLITWRGGGLKFGDPPAVHRGAEAGAYGAAPAGLSGMHVRVGASY
ncbi:hypothetical protein AB4Z54_21630 [Streptomyces sp. MCAF7]